LRVTSHIEDVLQNSSSKGNRSLLEDSQDDTQPADGAASWNVVFLLGPVPSEDTASRLSAIWSKSDNPDLLSLVYTGEAVGIHFNVPKYIEVQRTFMSTK